jgi:DNA-binding CsgD family transcriptional regulator
MFGARASSSSASRSRCSTPRPTSSSAPASASSRELDASGRYADERVMKRIGGPQGRAVLVPRLGPRARPAPAARRGHLGLRGPVVAAQAEGRAFTPREREIAALLVEGLTSKQIGRQLAISPRTVDVYRARLMRKLGAATTAELVNKLLSG